MARRCSVCSGPRAEAINAVLREPHHASIVKLAADFDVTRDALMRHRDRHLNRATAAVSVMTEDVLGVADHTEHDEHDAHRPWRQKARGAARAGVRIDSRKSTRAGRKAVPSDAKQRFLNEFSRSGNLSQSAAAAGVGRQTIYGWQEHDEAFALAFREAEIEAVEALEQEARERATKGGRLVREIYRGDRLIECVVEYRPSDPVLIKLLQALRPERYGEKLTVTATTVVKTIDAEAWDSV